STLISSIIYRLRCAPQSLPFTCPPLEKAPFRLPQADVPQESAFLLTNPTGTPHRSCESRLSRPPPLRRISPCAADYRQPAFPPRWPRLAVSPSPVPPERPRSLHAAKGKLPRTAPGSHWNPR